MENSIIDAHTENVSEEDNVYSTTLSNEKLSLKDHKVLSGYNLFTKHEIGTYFAMLTFKKEWAIPFKVKSF